MRVVALVWLAVVALASACHALEWEPGNECSVVATAPEGLQLAYSHEVPATIAPPRMDQDLAQWQHHFRAYRDQVRAGAGGSEVLRFDYSGVRSWVRLDPDMAAVLQRAPDAELTITFEARWLEGGSRLCFAYDYNDQDSGAWAGWSTVVAETEVPKTGEWERITVKLPAVSIDRRQLVARPIFGFDATHDSSPARVEVRKVSLSSGNPAVDKELSGMAVERASKQKPINTALYDREDLRWMSHAYTCCFAFMYDRSFYDPTTRRYLVDEFLNDGERQFGGYDIVMLWHAYPRIGLDQRNQYDFYRDMPGGLEGVRDVVRRMHERGVRVMINYNPWDRATQREQGADERELAQMVADLEVDGIFLDTMVAASPSLRTHVDAARRGVVFVPEAHPTSQNLGSLNGSWAQFPPNKFSPCLLHHKWIEPRHMEHQIRRWNTLIPNTDHAQEIENALFNGSGMMVWENIFGTYNPWRAEDRKAWRRASAVLHTFSEWFHSEEATAFYPTHSQTLFANRWPGDDAGSELFTLVNKGEPLSDAPLLSVPWRDGLRAYDLWRGVELPLKRSGDTGQVLGDVDKLGCVLVAGNRPPGLEELLQKQAAENERPLEQPDHRAHAHSVVTAAPVDHTQVVAKRAPSGMVYVPSTTRAFTIEHMRRECGCYPDLGTPRDQWIENLQGWAWSSPLRHQLPEQTIGPLYVDKTEVTNRQFKRFLDATGYQPREATNFLKHWNEGQLPQAIADDPVVYVDIDDARAYARWAGKRLPTEEEWQLAAQGTDGRKWPWGNEFEADRVNTTGALMPADSLAAGASPYGCLHMSGNVYELTESLRDDGHTRFLLLRGGSYFDPNLDKSKASAWYVDGGARPCEHHAKQILMWPGLDRCSTVGFRCVVDAE